ncbi:Hypothetical predicted protein [Octopus vulgaris]|uniref:Uncharacterized protein n=1 Tax=Octopus vulgaris TaxID=6645 RepID=A0AA36BAH9_OCTVU|nr:Hypothetical predicted protein [Octopus vulgaris]
MFEVPHLKMTSCEKSSFCQREVAQLNGIDTKLSELVDLSSEAFEPPLETALTIERTIEYSNTLTTFITIATSALQV